MNDIFISYKREEQAAARDLANALEHHGWTVWWDPRLRAGERFDDVIAAALEEARCVIVMWSRLSVKSQYVKDEATYALTREKLAPVMIEHVELPFRFERIHTPSLVDWGGSEDAPAFQGLVEDIEVILGSTANQVEQSSSKPEPRRQTREIFEPGSIFRDTLKDGTRGPEMVVIPAGTFTMGSPATEKKRSDWEGPQHEVTFTKPFAMGRYAVTFEEYDCFTAATEREMSEDEENWGRGRRPVINISWDDAKAYCDWLSQQSGKKYRLPSEAEWEYAARAGSTTAYWWGDEVGQNHANCDGCGSEWDGEQTAPMGSFEANACGLHDTSGNVWEWVQDCWHDDYENAPDEGSAWLEVNDGDCARRVVRGGSWGSEPSDVRSPYRFWGNVDSSYYDVGFRLAQDMD